MALLKLDEDLPRVVAEAFAGRGHEVRTVVEQSLGGSDDDAVWAAVRSESAILITGDKGFGDIRMYPPGTHAGIILLRPGIESVSAYRSLAERLLDSHELSTLAGTVTVMSERGIRIRRPAH